MGAAMIDLYFWTTPNGMKPLLFLEETGLEYRIRPINISKGEQFEPEFLKISPNNRIPAIVDHDPDGQGTAGSAGAPLMQFESGAILLYLAEKTGMLLPEDTAGRAEVMQWLFWQMGGIGPMFGQFLHFADYAPEKLPYAVERYSREAERLLRVLDRRLADREFAAGAYSIADIAIWPWCRAPDRRGVDPDDFPNVKAWFERVAARPAVARGIEVLAEHTRQGGHTPEAWNLMFGEGQYRQR